VKKKKKKWRNGPVTALHAHGGVRRDGDGTIAAMEFNFALVAHLSPLE
jgi:hypothetical protein